MMIMKKIEKPVFISCDDLVEIVNISFLGCHQLFQYLLPPEKGKANKNLQKDKKSECWPMYLSHHKRFCASRIFQRFLWVLKPLYMYIFEDQCKYCPGEYPQIYLLFIPNLRIALIVWIDLATYHRCTLHVFLDSDHQLNIVRINLFLKFLVCFWPL